MKMKMKSKLILGLLLAALSGASLSGTLITAKSDGAMQLPTFYVYASDSDIPEDNGLPVVSQWQFQKTLDFHSEPVAIQVLVPGNEIQSVNTPGIVSSLVGPIADNS